jgi:hypothetical protein
VQPPMSIGARHKAAVAKLRGEYKRAAQIASQRLTKKTKKAGTYPVPETDQHTGGSKVGAYPLHTIQAGESEPSGRDTYGSLPHVWQGGKLTGTGTRDPSTRHVAQKSCRQESGRSSQGVDAVEKLRRGTNDHFLERMLECNSLKSIDANFLSVCMRRLTSCIRGYGRE